MQPNSIATTAELILGGLLLVMFLYYAAKERGVMRRKRKAQIQRRLNYIRVAIGEVLETKFLVTKGGRDYISDTVTDAIWDEIEAQVGELC